MIGLSKSEVKVFKKLNLNEQSVADIVRATKMPRMTVYTNLLRLEKMKLAQEVKSDSGKRILWVKRADSFLEKEISLLALSLIGKEGGNKRGVIEYSGKQEVGDALMNLTTRKDSVRMYSVQSSKNWQIWLKLMGKEWVNKHNKAVVKHKLIALTIHSEEAPADIKKDKDITDAYKGRLGNSHAIPEEYLPRGLSLYIFEETFLLVDLENVRAISFTDQSMATFLVKMFAFMFSKSEREEFFQKFNQ